MTRLILFLCFLSSLSASERSIAIQDPSSGGPVPAAWAVEPVLEVPMQAPTVCRLADGSYVLTGTVPADRSPENSDPLRFQDNDGIVLWQSADLSSWQELSQVWSITRDAPHHPASAWQLKQRVPQAGLRVPESASIPQRGMCSPKPQLIDGRLHITYSMNGWGCGILRATTADPAGPYEDLGCVLPQASSLSLFVDEDERIYAVWDEGWFARLKPDLSGLADRPRLVQPRASSDLGHSPFTVGRGGAQLFRHEGIYYLQASEWTSRTGFAVQDTYVCAAESLDGPWGLRVLMLAHGGESYVFEGPAGQWYGTVGDSSARCRLAGKPGLAPLVFREGEWYNHKGPKLPYPWKPQHIITERGPWEQCRPITDYHLRDIHVLIHDDGYLYFTGSTTDKRLSYQVKLFRFKIDDAAAVGRGLGTVEECLVMRHEDIAGLDLATRKAKGRGGLFCQSMDTKVFHVGGTFYITLNLYSGGSLGSHKTSDGSFVQGAVVLRSTSGRWDGPYETVGRAPYAHCKLIEDEQGRIHTQRGWRGVMQLQPDGSFAVMEAPEDLPQVLYPRDGTSFCDDGAAMGGVHFAKEWGRHVWRSTEWNGPSSLKYEQRPSGTYNMTWAFSETDRISGPYPRCTNTLPHCGGAAQFRDSQGRYWSTFFGNEMTAPWYCRLGIIPLKVTGPEENRQVDIADSWPEGKAQAP